MMSALVLPLALIACGDDDNNTPPLAAPLLNDIPGTKTLTKDTAVAASAGLSFSNTGGRSLTACTVAPALPAGLRVAATSDKSTCEITGTPTAAAASAVYTVTARNATGTNTGKVSIVVADTLAAPVLAGISGTKTLTKDTAVVAGDGLTFTNSGGGSLSGCTVAPALPAGLNVAVTSDNMHCEITGTPTAVAASAEYMVTATNATGMAAGAVTIVVEADVLAAPVLANISGTKTLTEDTAVVAGDGLTFTNSGGGSLSGCTVAPALPAGLSVAATSDNMHCEITGTPTAAATSAQYTVTAANATGMDTGTVTIEVARNIGKPSTTPVAAASNAMHVINNTGAVSPNQIVITTTVKGDYTDTANTGVAGSAAGASPKMQWELSTSGATAGEVTVSVLATPGVALFTTLFDGPSAPAKVMDHSSFANGNIVFELSSADWGEYGATGTSNGMLMKIDHNISGGADHCVCDTPLDVSGLSANQWGQFTIPVSSLTAPPKSLDLTKIKTGIVIWPDPTKQNANPQQAVTFKVRNVRWEP